MSHDPHTDIITDGLRDAELETLRAQLAEANSELEKYRTEQRKRPPFSTPEYESQRNTMWRRAHMVATSKGYDHINHTIDAAPKACPDCGGCGGVANNDLSVTICATCRGSLGKKLQAENEALRKDAERLDHLGLLREEIITQDRDGVPTLHGYRWLVQSTSESIRDELDAAIAAAQGEL